jgi:hydroxymethylpyrimidine/phosphomethylpyrimidine kinase
MQQAAAELHKLGCTSVLIKGGHLAEKKQKDKQAAAAATTAKQQQDEEVVYAVDVLYDGTRCYYFTAPYIETTNTHGTGCTLAAAIATALANGQTPVQAVQTAKDYLTSVLAASVGLGLGAGPQHPFNHGAGFGRVQGGPMGLASNKTERPVKHRLNPVDLRMYVVTDAGCNAKTGRTLLQVSVST